MELTAEQFQAVELRGENLLVSAGAGSGKTRTLTERVVRLIEERACNIDECLILTFTNAAAAEMRSRIKDAINDRFRNAHDAATKSLMHRQLLSFGDAQISTVHSFCQKILQKHGSVINVDDFRVAGSAELAVLRREVIADLFEENYSDDAFQKFTDEFGGSIQGDGKIYGLIFKLHDFALSMANPAAWLDSLPAPYDLPENARLSDTIWFKIIKPHVDASLQKIFDDCAAARQKADDNFICVKTLADDARQIQTIKAARSWNELFDAFHSVTFARYSAGKGDPVVKAQIKALRDSYRQRIGELRDKIFIADEKTLLADTRAVLPSVKELVRVTKAFADKFSAAKSERNIIDFADMEQFTLKIFNAAPDIADALRNNFRFIMVDEYQDTNAVQEAIIQRIARGDNLFLVGDVKQSVYSFRLVDSANFKNKLTSCRQVNLTKNFRSRKQIICAANEIFARLMNARVTEIDFDAAATLKYSATYETGARYFDERPDFFCLEFDRDDETQIEFEMRFIADKILQIINSGKLIRDGDRYRPVQWRDIVILHRSPNAKTFSILNTLQRFGVPAFVPEEENFFRTKEIQSVISLLRVLDNVHQDIPLAAVMMNFGGFNVEELADLRATIRDDLDFYDAVKLGSDKCKKFLDKINDLRGGVHNLRMRDILGKIFATEFLHVFAAESQSDARRANLIKLIDYADEIELIAGEGLSCFLDFVDKLAAIKKDLPAATVSRETDNVVRVMSIHHCKGLEFPVVFVAGLGKPFNRDNYSANKVFLHKQFGLGVMLTNNSFATKTLPAQAVALKIRQESVAEELRLLYVAVTRAKEKLILVAAASKAALQQPAILDDFAIADAHKFSDWLLPLKDALLNVWNFHIVTRDAVKNLPDVADTTDAADVTRVADVADVAVKKLPRRPKCFCGTKFAVTELNRFAVGDSYDFPLPDVLRNEFSGLDFGALWHKIMRRLDFHADLSVNGIAAQIRSLAQKKIIPPEHVNRIRPGLFVRFFQSVIGQRLLAAQKIYRELPFNQLVPAADFFRADGKILVQGIIDLLFQDAHGRWVLLDYKTDRNTADIATRYRTQINLYAAAAESILNISVDDKFLYLTGSNQFIKI